MNAKNIASNRSFRDLGFKDPWLLPCGKENSIADVGGVAVGHKTISRGDTIRTGVTVVDPGVADLFRRKLPCGAFVANGFGKCTGLTQIEELGTLETPIALTNTLSVGAVMEGMVRLTLQSGEVKAGETVNAVVGETNDGYLNDIHAMAVTPEDAIDAYQARTAAFERGCVGAGTGARLFSWKGGIGTASRIALAGGKSYVLGILVQTNFGGALQIFGTPIGKLLGSHDFKDAIPAGDGSCMIVCATDAPLSARQLKRIAKRVSLGLVRTGSVFANGSGDYAIAFSTDREGFKEPIADAELNGLFLAAVESSEEAVLDALVQARTTAGRDGNTLERAPIEKIRTLIKSHGN